MAKVSIIVPVYNTEKYLERCLNSILDQTYKDIEIILIDDNSSDDSYKIINRYKMMNYDKIKVIKNTHNIGPGASRNKGLDIASGEYILFVDSDDYIEPKTIEKMYSSCEDYEMDISRINMYKKYHDIDVSFLGRKNNIKESKIIVPKKEIKYLSREFPCVTNKMFRRNLIAQKRFPENLKWEDYPFTIPLLYKSNGVITVSDDDAKYNYNVNLTGTTVSDSRKVSPKILDIFACSDIIKNDLMKESNLKEVEEHSNLISIINCLQRTRDVLYSDMSISRKKELISLLSELINKKYGSWQENKLFTDYRKERKIYQARLKLIESFFLQDEYSALSEEELEKEINKTINKIYTLK